MFKNIFKVCVIIAIIIFITMADPNWGLLTKAQDDNETIEDAITRLIDAHIANAGAHASEGESIAVHKAQDVLDHPAGSVLADKDTMTEFVIKDVLKTLDGWSTLGEVGTGNWPGVELYVEWGAVHESKMSVQSSMPSQFFQTDFDMVFQTTMYLGLAGPELEAWLGIAINSILPGDGFGFIFDNGVTKAVFAIGNQRNFSDEITNDEETEHVYRAQYNALTQEAKFYIDGDLKATVAKPTGTGSLDIGASIGVKITEDNDGNMVIGAVTMSRAI